MRLRKFICFLLTLIAMWFSGNSAFALGLVKFDRPQATSIFYPAFYWSLDSTVLWLLLAGGVLLAALFFNLSVWPPNDSVDEKSFHSFFLYYFMTLGIGAFGVLLMTVLMKLFL